MFKYVQAGEDIKKINEVSGIDRLLTKLEYNALTEIGRQISDYGVPSNILEYYEAKEFQNYGEMNRIKSNLDNYELTIFAKTEKLINNNV